MRRSRGEETKGRIHKDPVVLELSCAQVSYAEDQNNAHAAKDRSPKGRFVILSWMPPKAVSMTMG